MQGKEEGRSRATMFPTWFRRIWSHGELRSVNYTSETVPAMGKRISFHVLSLWCVCAHAMSLQSCPTLCEPMDHSPSGSSVCGILQARILEWVATPSSRRSSWSRDPTGLLVSPTLASRFFTTSTTWEPQSGFRLASNEAWSSDQECHQGPVFSLH